MQASEISRSGLDVEWQRLQVIAENLANANTSRTASGQPYQPTRLLTGPAGPDFGETMAAQALTGVTVLGREPIAGAMRRVHDPAHPHADTDGFVTYPDVSQAGEMALLIKTARVYEANLTAMGIAHQMYARALDLGNRS